MIGRLSAIQIRLLKPRRHLPDWYEKPALRTALRRTLPFSLYQSDVTWLPACASVAPVFRPQGQRHPRLASIRLESADVPVEFSSILNPRLRMAHHTLVGANGLLINDMFRDILVRLPDDREHRAADHFRTWPSPPREHGPDSSAPAPAIWRRLDFGTSARVMRRFVAPPAKPHSPERIAWSTHCASSPSCRFDRRTDPSRGGASASI